MNDIIALFGQLIRDYGPLVWLCAILLFFAGFLLGRFLVIPALRKRQKQLEDLMQLHTQAEASLEKLQEKIAEQQRALQEEKQRLQSKEQLAAVWEREARNSEEKLHQAELRLQERESERENYRQRLLELIRQGEEGDARLKELESELKTLREENRQLVSQLSTEQLALEQVAQMQSTLNAALQRLNELESKWREKQPASEKTAVENEAFTPQNHGEELLEENLNPSSKELLPEDETERAKAWIKTSLGKGIPEAQGQDDLSRIDGIGPFIESQLRDLGLCSFEQIAALDGRAIEQLTKAIRFIPGRIRKDRWVEQAAALLKSKSSGKAKQRKKQKSKGKGSLRTQPDDLKLIEGIGPKIEEVLNKAGIKTWQQLATQSVEQLQKILASAGKRFTLHKPDSWPRQAQLAAEGKWKELKALQDEL